MSATTALREYRENANLTLEQFGAQFGVNKSTVMRWEDGQIPAERVLAISKATGIPPSKLRPDIYPAPRKGRAA